ncbi:MAG TPA: DinB family protein [Micromonosporaceae bacterium]
MTDGCALDVVRDETVRLARYACERLRGRLVGMSDDEYFWEPVAGCWSVRRGRDGVYRQDGNESQPDPVPAPLTTIAWRVCHIIDVISSDHNATWLGLTPVALSRRGVGEPATATAAVDLLTEAFSAFERCLSTTDSARLTEPMGPIARAYGTYTRLSFVVHQVDELVHHGAEVATLRDLYRAMGRAGARSLVPAQT